ncbi:GNAT family N-acetyltransferase [Enterococcus casseliflavus]|uniref:GNAT family N-acetyltransferase n=1 Tax=Enterococcus casseliflavus TaxID=37734 RepID=UPI000FFB6324|nr:N-acetyltransferase [Enterococcus casseliflavus]RXA63888.1 GNAT family N-acetyltransferase [Enterococcus casseliflavus]
MIRFAKKEDRFVMAELVLVILKDMELPFVKEIGEAKTLEILADAMLEPNYRYGFRRALVNEIDGEVAGVAFGYPDKEEATIDQPLDKVLEQYGLSKDMKLFIDEETLPNEWYLDTICVAEKFRGKGVGSALLEALPKIASRDGYEVIGLSVDRANPHAKRLYEKHGFEVVAQREISGHLYDHMQKRTS